MRRGDISRLVTPNCPCPERNLAGNQRHPEDRQSLERSHAPRVSSNTETNCNHSDRDKKREKPVCHLQPDLERSHVGKPLSIAPGIDLCQRSRAGVWNPRAICGGKIENRQVAMLVAHRRGERKLYINRKRYRNGQCCDRPNILRIEQDVIESSPKF